MKQIYALWILLIGAAWGIQGQTYCTAVGPSSTIDTEIRDVFLSGDNYGINNPTSCPGVAGLRDFTLIDSADLSLGTSYSLEALISTCGGVYTSFARAWIDYNGDGDFTDANEELGSWGPLSPAAFGSTVRNLNLGFTVPSGATLGRTRMRIMLRESGSTTTTTPCATFFYGSVQDYTIHITNTPPLCPTPGMLNVSALGSNGATIAWTSTGSNFNVEYGPQGFTQGTGTTISAAGSSINLTGLMANSCYDVYVQNDCQASGNGSSSWAGPISFCTLCTTTSMPITEGFSVWPPNCWSYNTGSTPWLNSTSGGGFYAHADFWSQNQESYILESPAIQINQSARIVFDWSHLYSSSYPDDSLSVRIKSVSASQWTTLQTLKGQTFTTSGAANQSPAPSFTHEIIYVPSSYLNDTVQIQLYAWSDWGPDLFVDHVTIEAQPACPEPLQLGSSIITDSTALVNWQSSASSFIVQWGPVGFTAGTGSYDTVYTNSATLTNLFPNTEYDFYVMADCDTNGTSIWSGPYTLRTLCSSSSIGYFENWDQMTAGDPPTCWNMTATGNGNSWQVLLPSTFNTQPYSSPHLLYVYTSAATDVTVVSPLFADLPSNSAQVRFRANKYYSFATSKLVVGTMISPTNPSSFVPIDTITLTANWDEYTVAFPNVSSGHYHVALRIIGGTYNYLALDDFYYEAQPSCLPAQNVSASPGTTTALVSWAHGATSTTGSYIAWGPSGFNPGTGTIPNLSLVNSNTYTIAGLTPATTYTVWVADSCGSGNIGPWQGPVTFTTACLAATMPYLENFDIYPLSCWDETGGNKVFLSYTLTSGGNAMNGNFWYWPTGNWAELTSRPVTISSNAQVSFDWSHQYSSTWGAGDQLLLLARPVTSASWDTLVNLEGPSFNTAGSGYTSPGSWVNELAYLPSSYTGSDVIFKFIGNSGYGPDVFFDNFVVEAIPSCPDPVPSAGTVTNTTAAVSWTSPGSPLGTCVMWGPAGFYTGTGSVTGTIAHNVSSTYTISGLSAGTTYDVYVRDSCGPNDFSDWAGPVTVTTALCPPINSCTFTMYEIDSFGDGWNGGQITVEQKSSTGWAPIFTFGLPFTTGSSYTETANLCAGDSARVIVTNPGSWSTEIGFDLVGPFGDTVSSWTPGTSLMAFQVFNTFVAQCSACGVPSGVTATAPACTTATVSWSSGSQATGSTVEYGPAGFAQGQGTTVSASASGSVTLTGLQPGTSYDVIVQDNCNGTTSGWSTAVTFTTAAGPLPTLNPNFTVISMNPVTISFTANASGQDTVGWAFSNGAIQGGDAVTQAFSSNGPAFAVAVAANACGIVADTVYFTVGLDDLNLTSLRLFPNPTAGQFTVEFSHLDAEDVEFRIVSLTGAVITQVSRYADAGTVRETFDLSKTPAGVYLVEVQTTSGSSVRRIVLER